MKNQNGTSGFSYLSDAIRKHISIYGAILPYNLNWIRKFDFVSEFLGKNPISVIDIGARGFLLEELENLRPYINYVAFDADKEEVRKMNENGGNMGFNSVQIYPYFVGKEMGMQSFHLYNKPGDSSQLSPDLDFQKYFGTNFSIKETVQVDGITLDSFIKDKDVDVIKLDTQGSEYDILLNGQAAIDKALLVESEVEFFEMYEKQKLFHDISKFLHERNFTLLYLNRVFMNRNNFKGPSRGQLVFGDALFGLNRKGVEALTTVKKKKYCILLINYGLNDYAFDIFSEDEKLRAVSPELARFFSEFPNPASLFQKIKRRFWMQAEKLIALSLFIRKTNQLKADSDRSWPIR